MVQGEGAGIFVFEEYERAKKRGAEILAEVAGFAMSSDAADIVMPSKNGAARAIKGAMKDALDVVPNVARGAKVNVALSNAFAFGGLNAVLALKRFT